MPITLSHSGARAAAPDDRGVRVKICGVKDAGAIDAAAAAGAAYLGFVFFPKSPRHLHTAAAAALTPLVPPGICKVGLFVDPDDAFLSETLDAAALDMVQLHGSETPERVAAVRALSGLPVMKAVKIGDQSDLPMLDAFDGVADQVLCDAKPHASGELPGGNGVAFDWRLIEGRRWRGPWMLAGGLTPDTAAQAATLTGANQIDVSSGVEASPGVKDPQLIKAFIDQAQRARTA